MLVCLKAIRNKLRFYSVFRMVKTHRPTFLLVHGWGFDRHFFDPLVECLPQFTCVTIDLGFTGNPIMPALDGEAPTLAVGHSMGFMWLLRQKPAKWRGLVGINAFPRFTETEEYRPAQPVRVLELMQEQYFRKPDRATADFMSMCGNTEALKSFDTNRMAESLTWLADWDEREALANEPAPVFALAGKADQIVLPAMTEAGFGGAAPIQWHDGGHLLPMEDPAWCAERLAVVWDSL